MLPKGVATFLPEATAQKRYVEDSIFSVFRRWGYREVIPPLFEYLDVIASGLSEDLIEKGYKFVDRSNGRLMLLRPDVTPQIARMAAMQMSDRPMPLRLCYRANVFRHEAEHAGRAREIFQIGGELIGLNNAAADAEMIAIAIESLARLGLTDFKVTVSHSGFFRGYLDSLNLSLDLKQQIKSAMSRKDKTQIRSILKATRLSKREHKALLEMPSLFGGTEAIDRAEAIATLSGCRQALKRLREVIALVSSSGWKECLVVDLSEVRGFEYYTGIVFEVFVKRLGYAVGRGGRYDQLIGRFGPPSPSTGFAFDIENVQSAWQEYIPSRDTAGEYALSGSADVLLLGAPSEAGRVFRFAKSLRDLGCRVAQAPDRMIGKEALAYARSVGISSIAILKNPGLVVLMDSGTGKKTTMKRKAFLERAMRQFRQATSGGRPDR